MSALRKVVAWLGLSVVSLLWAGTLRGGLVGIIFALVAIGGLFSFNAIREGSNWQIIACVWWGLFLLVCLGWRLRRLELKGHIGEMLVQATLRAWLPSARRFHDIYTRYEDGITQIDHVVVSNRGVFVIETKNWDSRMRGYAEEPTWWIWYRRNRVWAWLRRSRDDSKKGRWIKNPVKQNAIHTAAVTAILGKDTPIFPIVALVGRGRLVNQPVSGIATGLADLICAIRARHIVMDNAAVAKIATQLEAGILTRNAETMASYEAQFEAAQRAAKQGNQI